PGSVPTRVSLPSYRDLSPGSPRGSNVVLRSGPTPLFRFRLARGADTIALDTVSLTASSAGQTVSFTSPFATIHYTTSSDGYRTEVRGSIPNAPAGSSLVIDLPTTLESVEADTLDDMRHLAYGFKRPRRDVESIPFSKLEPLETRSDTGGMQWVAARNKYWLV